MTQNETFASGINLIRSTYRAVGEDSEYYAIELMKAKDENAKLRELARRMWPFAKAYLSMLPMLGVPDSESCDIEVELKRMHVI